MTQEQLILGVVIFFAAFTQGTLGFAFGLIVMGVIPHFLPIKEAIPIVAIFGLGLNAYLFLRYRRSIIKDALLLLIAGGVAGVPLGVAILHTQPPELLERILGAVIVFAALWSLFGASIANRGAGSDVRGQRPVAAFSGLLGGVLGGGFNIGGPPVVIYGAWARWSPNAFRGTIQAYFFVLVVLQIALMSSTDLLSIDTLRMSVPYLPVLAIGAWLGAVCGDRLHPDKFARAVLWALVVLGILFFLR